MGGIISIIELVTMWWTCSRNGNYENCGRKYYQPGSFAEMEYY